MILKERLEYLNKNRQHGDLARVVKAIRNKKCTLQIVQDVINGKLHGAFGERVASQLERIIEKRAKAIKIQKAKYLKKLEQASKVD
jgi:hypothetical protein